MQKRGETQKGFLVALIVIIVAVVGVSYLSPGSTGKAISTVDGEASSGEDTCPNPTSSAKACVGQKMCIYKCLGDRRERHIVNDICPEIPGCTKDQEIKIEVYDACAWAKAASNEPGLCSHGCYDLGIVEHEEIEAPCCKVTKERNCVERPKVR